jgi:hypothetical protein
MVEPIRYGAGGVPMVNQKPRVVEPVEPAPKVKKKTKPLQEIYPDPETDGFDEEHGDGE